MTDRKRNCQVNTQAAIMSIF